MIPPLLKGFDGATHISREQYVVLFRFSCQIISAPCLEKNEVENHQSKSRENEGRPSIITDSVVSKFHEVVKPGLVISLICDGRFTCRTSTLR